jgi:hypothetical protein
LRDKSELHERVVITPLNLSNQLATLFAVRQLKSLKLLVSTTEIPLNDLQSSIDLIKPLLSIGDLPSFDGQRSCQLRGICHFSDPRPPFPKSTQPAFELGKGLVHNTTLTQSLPPD